MNKRKYYGKKIKKTKNLYRKRKTAGQRVFGTVLLVAAISGAAFLGFCIGKPLLDYLGNAGSENSAEWTPAASYSEKMETTPGSEGDVDGAEEISPEYEPDSTTPPAQDEAPATVPEKTAETTAPNNGETEPIIVPVGGDTLISTAAPANTLANRSSLAAFLAKAKTKGFNSAVLQLKDKNGYFRYKTSIAGVEDGDLIADTMTLDEIMSVFAENGMVPVAEISVLSDNAGCEVFSDMSYKCMGESVSWLDYTQNPPKRWANPEKEDTREYFAGIIAELTSAGFDNIMLADVVFPDFQSYDSAYIEPKYFAADRYKLLYNVIKAGNTIEMKASDVLSESYGRTAEVLGDISQLHDNRIALIISRSDLPTDAGYPADAKSLVETVLSLASKKTGSLDIIPVIDSTSFDDAEKQKIVASLGTLGYESYVIK
ncbi:MAG: hypothetical protein IJT87_09610 [Ruminiclostridium sp.]|nr:hypothetical protein [Ruminiclostridium sp.]